jgi:hypothetical protein
MEPGPNERIFGGWYASDPVAHLGALLIRAAGGISDETERRARHADGSIGDRQVPSVLVARGEGCHRIIGSLDPDDVRVGRVDRHEPRQVGEGIEAERLATR